MLGVLLTCKGFRPLHEVGRVCWDCWGLRRDADSTCTSVVCIQCGSCKGRQYGMFHKIQSKEHIPSEANSRSASQENPQFLLKREFQCSCANNQVHIVLLMSLISIIIVTFHLRRSLSNDLFPSGCPTSCTYHYCVSCRSHFCSDHFNKTRPLHKVHIFSWTSLSVFETRCEYCDVISFLCVCC